MAVARKLEVAQDAGARRSSEVHLRNVTVFGQPWGMTDRIKRLKSRLDVAELAERDAVGVLYGLIADAYPDEGEVDPRRGSMYGWKARMARSASFTPQHADKVRDRVREERRKADVPVRAVTRAEALSGIAVARAAVDARKKATAKARRELYRAIAAAMPAPPEAGKRASGPDRDALDRLREATGYDTSTLRWMQEQGNVPVPTAE